MAVEQDAWLAEVLGFPVFVVGDDADLGGAEGRALWYAKLDVSRTAEVARLEGQGFRVVDVNVTLQHGGARAPAAAGIEVGPAAPGEHERLVEIAASCFRYSRFHLDPQLPDELADRVKGEWVRSYAEGRRGLELLAARDGERPIGFLAVLERGGARVIDLVGVDAAKQGRGVGDALVGAFIERHSEPSDELLVGTQISNRPSLRLYARHGFEIDRASYVLHRHAWAT